MNLIFHGIVWGILVLVLVGLYLYRHWLENHDDPYIHLHSDVHDSAIVTTQTSMNKRLEMVDKFKYALLIAVIIYAIAIAGMAAYSAWNTPVGI